MTTLALSHALFSALLALYPHAPARACLETRAPRIEAALAAAQDGRGVPAGALLATAWQESWVGCNQRSGGSWGAPINFAHRHVAGGADEAAAVLEDGMRRCGSLRGAVVFFRSGSVANRCATPARHAAYVARVLALAARLYAAAGVAMPQGVL